MHVSCSICYVAQAGQ